MSAVFPLILFSQSVKTIHVTAGDDINALLGDDKYLVDSLVITGELKTSDFDVLAECTKNGLLRGIDMADCIVEDNTITGFEESPLQYITMPKTLKTIGMDAFNNSGLRHIDIPPLVESIGFQSFQNTYSANEPLVIPEGVVTIDTAAFNCSFITELTLPSSLRSIKCYAFAQCYKLEKVEISEGVELIEPGAFATCDHIKEITLPESVKEIGTGVFGNCHRIEKVKLPSGLEILPKGTFYRTKIKEISLPENLKEIGKDGLDRYYGEELILPDALSVIGEEVLYSIPNMRRLVLPANLMYVASQHFGYYCENLKEVYAKNPVPPATDINSNANSEYPPFGELPDDAVLYVPVGSLELYKACHFFDRFTDIRETSTFPTSIGQVLSHDAGVAVKGGRGEIVISSDNGAGRYAVYSADGKILHRGTAEVNTRIDAKPGLYVVKADGKTVKVMVR